MRSPSDLMASPCAGHDSPRLFLKISDDRMFRLLPEAEAIPPGLITDGSTANFVLSGPCLDVFDVDFVVDGVPLNRIPEGMDRVRWKWDIDFHTGRVDVALSMVGRARQVFELVTDPVRSALVGRDYRTMIGEILSDSVGLVELAGFHAELARRDTCLEVARFEYLRGCFDQIEAIVQEIDRQTVVHGERRVAQVPLGRSGGVTPLELSRAARDVVTLDTKDLEQLTPRARAVADALGGGLPRNITRRAGQRHGQRQEHADILSVLMVLRRFLTDTRRQLRVLEVSDAAGARTVIMHRQCEAMLHRLGRLQRLQLFKGLSPTHGPIRLSQPFLMEGPFRRFFSAYRRLLDGLSNIDGDFLRLPLQRTSDLYARWCFLRLLRTTMLRQQPAGDWCKGFIEKTAQGGLTVSLEGRPFRFQGYTLIFQRVYQETWKSAGPRVGSFSREMRPDIALEMGPTPDAPTVPVIVLDAKYRVEDQINDAIVSLHMYRDALVEATSAEQPGQNERTVKAAFVLMPSMPGRQRDADEDGLPWRSDSPPRVFFRPQYRQAFKFGAVILTPGMSDDQVLDVLKSVVASVGTESAEEG